MALNFIIIYKSNYTMHIISNSIFCDNLLIQFHKMSRIV